MKIVLCFLFGFLSMHSCSGQGSKDSAATVQPATLKIQRFDKDFHQYLTDPTDINKQKTLKARYEEFLPAFGRVTINNSDSYKKEFYIKLQQYFSNDILTKIYNDAINTFSDVSKYELELSNADYLIAQNFKGKHLPSLYMHVSGFKENVMVLDNMISISGDKYLGMDYPIYKQFFENYQLIQMQPKMVSRDYLKAWLVSEKAIFAEPKKTLLTEMVNEGKILYALSVLLPEWNAADLIAYTPEQFKWCNDNESIIWKQIIQQNHLYDSNFLTIQKYISEAPYTVTLSSESPGRVGCWVGWQIVKAYMNKNNIQLTDLLAADSQKILKGSLYNPATTE